MTKFKACLIFILLFKYKADAQNKTSNAIDSCVLKFMRDYQIPGCAIVILKDNTIVRMKAYGLASLEYHVPVSIKTKFLLDSQTKLFTAIAIMKLQEEGKVKLDDPINLYLDSIPTAWKNVTVRNLLTHSSGIRDNYVPWYNGSSSMEYSQQELYHYALQQPLEFNTGDRVVYNNLDFFLATILIEKISHIPYPNYMVERFFSPLGLGSISFADQHQVVENYATAYALENNQIVHMRDYAISQQGFSYMMKASIEELARFDKMFSEGKVLNRESIAEMRTFFVTNDHITGIEELGQQFQGIAYETNFINGYTTYAKGGSAGTMYVKIPGLKLTVIVLSNREKGHSTELSLQLARIADPALAIHHPLKDPDPALTKKMRGAFVEMLSGKFDSAKMNPKFFLLFPASFYEKRKADLPQLQSFTYAGEQKMQDRKLVLSGEHADRVLIYNVKIGHLEFPQFFYLSDQGKILSVNCDLPEWAYF
jgi:CubicO group peptidase (beta-lactamase class C family)